MTHRMLLVGHSSASPVLAPAHPTRPSALIITPVEIRIIWFPLVFFDIYLFLSYFSIEISTDIDALIRKLSRHFASIVQPDLPTVEVCSHGQNFRQFVGQSATHFAKLRTEE